MLALTIGRAGGPVRRYSIDRPEVTLGFDATNDIVLAGPRISPRHARVVLKDGKYIVVDLRTPEGTFVNGQRMTSPMVIRPGETVSIGDYTIRIGLHQGLVDPTFEEPEDGVTGEVDATELRLLASIAAREPGAREVYADWLEQQGRPAHAELLRLEETSGSFHPRMQQLALETEPRWRMRVSQGPILGCDHRDCPGKWSELAMTSIRDERSCRRCTLIVRYAITYSQARLAAQEALPTVLDALLSKDAYEVPPWRYGTWNPPPITAPPPPAPAPAQPMTPPDWTWQPGGCGDDPEADD